MSSFTTISALLNNKELSEPHNILDFVVIASFDDESNQANLSIGSIELSGSAREEVLKWIEDGKNGGVGIFEGIPFEIRAFNKSNQLVIFDGIVDLTREYKDFPSRGVIQVQLAKKGGLLELSERLTGITFGGLLEKGFLKESDFQTVGYVVEKPFNILEQISNGIILYMLSKELASLLKDLGKDGATTSGISASSVTGAVGGSVHAIIATSIQIIYTATMAILVFRLAKQLFDSFVPPKREHKTLSLRKGLEAISQELGYSFESDISDLDNIHLLASNTNFDQSTIDGLIGKVGSIDQGIPSVSDYGYNASEYFTLAKDLFTANITIIDDILYLNWKGSDFFQRQSSVTLPDILDDSYTYNTDEALASSLYSFSTDVVDSWTIENYKGTAYQVLLSPKVTNDTQATNLKGASSVNYNVALGNRKNKLNAFEKSLVAALSVFDDLLNTLGGAIGVDSNLSKDINDKIGLLKVSNNNHSLPKLLWLENGKIPSDHRDKLSAKALYDKYGYWNSFVSNADNSQKKVFNEKEIPFTFDDFVKVINNSYIFTNGGASAKYNSIEWQFLAAKAKASYFIREKYTDNLTETFIEP